jgi:sodium/bile acid cotransporter 7
VNALKNYKFNLAVQTFNFMFVSVASWGLSRFLLSVGATSQNLADGLTITSCLPMTINMVIVLTKSSGGDEASAVFNAAAGNLMGVFLTPALVLMYLGESEGIDIGTVFLKLAVRVLLPIFVGQIIQYKIPVIKDYVAARKWYFKKSTEVSAGRSEKGSGERSEPQRRLKIVSGMDGGVDSVQGV